MRPHPVGGLDDFFTSAGGVCGVALGKVMVSVVVGSLLIVRLSR